MRKLHRQETVNKKVALIKMELCSTPLASLATGSSSSGEIKTNSCGAVFRHDYLKVTVEVEVTVGEETVMKEETYLIEKVRKTPCGVFSDTQVNVRKYSAVENEKVRLTIDLKRLKLPVIKLYEELMKGAKVYNLFSLNCWHYGHEKATVIINLLLEENPEMAVADKEVLEQSIDNLKTKERPSVVDCFRLIYKPWSSRNEKTWNKLDNRCRGKWWAERPAKILRKRHNMFFNRGSSSQGIE